MIAELVSSLPEIYQPIYSHPELSAAASRRCEDRLASIVDVYDGLQRLLERPLKVLDLGCAQGFFSFHLAQRGAVVHGIDFLDKNVAVCSALSAEHPQLAVGFEVDRIEDAIEKLTADQYDLVLGLSVFHHIIHEKGVDEVRALLDRVACQCGALVVELALRDEPLYWGASQPQEPRSLLDSVAFVHEMGKHETHLSELSRPLYVASNRYWLLDGKAGGFDSWSQEPHALAHGTHQGSRRYFFSADLIIKQYRFDHPRGEHNRSEFSNELRFLKQPIAGFRTAACPIAVSDETEGWIAMERFPGVLLLELLRAQSTVDHRQLLLSILEQLALLESAGLYHSDVRTWNVIVSEGGTARLIDYGSISPMARDAVWPSNVFLAFLIFVREVVTGVVEDPDPLRNISISPYRLPAPYQEWAELLWQRPLSDWSFQLMHAMLTNAWDGDKDKEVQVRLPGSEWMKAIEEAINIQRQVGQQLRHRIDEEKHGQQRTLEMVTNAFTSEVGRLKSEVVAHQSLLASAQERAAVCERLASGAEAKAQWLQQQSDESAQKSEQWKRRAHEVKAKTQLLQRQIDELAQRERQALEAAAMAQTRLRQHIEESVQQAEQWQYSVSEAEIKMQRLQRQLDESSQSIAQRQHHAVALESERDALRASLSWRITGPLRWGAKGIFRNAPKLLDTDENHKADSSLRNVQRPLAAAMRVVLKRPALAYQVNQQLLRYPKLHQQLTSLARRGGLMPETPARTPALPDDGALSSLTPYAREIYGRIKTAIKRHQKEQS